MNGETNIALRIRADASRIVLSVTPAVAFLTGSVMDFMSAPVKNKGRCPFWVTACGVSNWNFAAGRYPLLMMGIIRAIIAAQTKAA
jgi:hypothetical protein